MNPLSLNQHNFIVTYSGRRVNVLDMRTEDVNIGDIAHSLSQLCRFTGHCRDYFSVAEHSWIASMHVPAELALEALLHDAAEAYVNDLSRPLKHHPSMEEYRLAEQRVDRVIRAAFHLPIFEHEPHMSEAIKDVDNKLVVTEARALMADSAWADTHAALDVGLYLFAPKTAERMFLQRYYRLTGRA